MRNTRAMPIILRDEPDGGILYDPAEATLIELDRDAFELALRVFHRRETAAGPEAAAMARQLQSMIAWSPKRRTRRVKAAGDFRPDVDFHVFAAPTLVDFQITGNCRMQCPHCYANAVPDGAHVPLEDVELVIRQCRDSGVCQLALGGGEPLSHPHIREILALCREAGVVPNLSTNGMHLGVGLLAAMRHCCGAVALSLEGVGETFARWRRTGFEHFKEALERLRAARIRTVLQVTLSAANFDELDDIAEFCLSRPQLYGVIFLAYKPVGRGEHCSRPLAELPAQTVCDGLQRAMLKLHGTMRVGYDCCLTPAIVGGNEPLEFLDPSHVEGCSGLRGSVGVSTGLDVLPCTFLGREVIGNLKERSLAEVWQSPSANEFRRRLQRHSQQTECRDCAVRDRCLGGCPALPLVGCRRGRRVAASRNERICTAAE